MTVITLAIDLRTINDLIAANESPPWLQQVVCKQEQMTEFSAMQDKLQQSLQRTEQYWTEFETDITFQQASEIFERLWQRSLVKMGYPKVK